MERPVPRQRTRASGAAIRGSAPAIAARLAGSADIFARHGRRPWASVNFVASHDGFTLTDAVSLRRASQRGERRRQPRRPSRQLHQQLGRGGADRRSGDQRHAREVSGARCWPPCSSRPARRCCWPATSSAAPRVATTMRIARTTRYPGSTGTWRRRRRESALTAYVGAAHRAAPRASGAAPAALPARQGTSCAGHRRHRVVRSDGQQQFRRGVERSRTADVGAAPRHASAEGKVTILNLAAQPDGRAA